MAQVRRMMDKIAKTDYESLSLGYLESSRTDVSIVGLELQVWGLEEIRDSDRPLGVLVVTHGRLNNAKNMYPFSHGILGHLKSINHPSQGEGSRLSDRERDLIVVTFDQRNHGTRLKDRVANLAFDENPRHLYDMAACVAGGCQDVSLIITFLGAYLFPNGEKQIDHWAATGFSLGGNITWRLMREEPRISTFIPLLGLPSESFMPYLRARAINLDLEWGPPIYPPSIVEYFEAPTKDGVYRGGKKVLSVHGADDNLVPYRLGKEKISEIKEEVETVENEGEAIEGVLEVKVVEGVGHTLTPDMVKMTAEWLQKWSLRI